MKTVWRTEVPIRERATLGLPHLIRPLCVAPLRPRLAPPPVGDRVAELWYEADPDKVGIPEMTVWFEGTGHPIDHDGAYLGTIQIAGGALIWHVYWRIEP